MASRQRRALTVSQTSALMIVLCSKSDKKAVCLERLPLQKAETAEKQKTEAAEKHREAAQLAKQEPPRNLLRRLTWLRRMNNNRPR